jgi:hypothetical protein
MKFELTEQDLNNLKVFLNRVKYEGLQEAIAVTNIINALMKPVNDTEK